MRTELTLTGLTVSCSGGNVDFLFFFQKETKYRGDCIHSFLLGGQQYTSPEQSADMALLCLGRKRGKQQCSEKNQGALVSLQREQTT